MYRYSLMLCGMALATLCAGCSVAPSMDYSKAELVSATGTVKLDGQPLSNATIIFEAEDRQFSFGTTDANGYYKLQFDTVMSGVRPGKKVVRISTTRKMLGPDGEEPTGSEENPVAAQPDGEKVPLQYNQKSQLTVEVTPDRSSYDFDLASK